MPKKTVEPFIALVATLNGFGGIVEKELTAKVLNYVPEDEEGMTMVIKIQASVSGVHLEILGEWETNPTVFIDRRVADFTPRGWAVIAKAMLDLADAETV